MRKNSERITVLMLTLLSTYGRDTMQYMYTLVVIHPKIFVLYALQHALT